MKLEFDSNEVKAMLKGVVQDQFPNHEIVGFAMTTYEHLIVELKELDTEIKDDPTEPSTKVDRDTSVRFEDEYGG